MADYEYAGIAAAEVAPGAPLTTSLAYRLAYEWIAAMQGADGAPRLRLASIGETLVAGDVTAWERPDQIEVDSEGVYVLAYRWPLWRGGTVRLVWDHGTPNGELYGHANVYVDGVTVGAYMTPEGTEWATRSLDVTVPDGGLLELRHCWVGSTGTAALRRSRIRNASLRTNGQQIMPLGGMTDAAAIKMIEE